MKNRECDSREHREEDTSRPDQGVANYKSPALPFSRAGWQGNQQGKLVETLNFF